MHKKVTAETVANRLIYALMGIVLGLVGGAVVAYAIAFFITPKEQEPSLIFVLIFALITSQLGMILGPHFALKALKKKEDLHDK